MPERQVSELPIRLLSVFNSNRHFRGKSLATLQKTDPGASGNPTITLARKLQSPEDDGRSLSHRTGRAGRSRPGRLYFFCYFVDDLAYPNEGRGKRQQQIQASQALYVIH